MNDFQNTTSLDQKVVRKNSQGAQEKWNGPLEPAVDILSELQSEQDKTVRIFHEQKGNSTQQKSRRGSHIIQKPKSTEVPSKQNISVQQAKKRPQNYLAKDVQTCKKCGFMFGADVPICPSCGTTVETSENAGPKRHVVFACCIAFLIGVVGMLFWTLVPKIETEDPFVQHTKPVANEMIQEITEQIDDAYQKVLEECAVIEAKQGALAVLEYLHGLDYDIKDSKHQALIGNYQKKVIAETEEFVKNRDYAQAIQMLWAVPDYLNSDIVMGSLSDYFQVFTTHRIAAGRRFNAKINRDNTVTLWGKSEKGTCNTENWENVASVCTGDFFVAGLCADGTVLVTGPEEYYGSAANWKDVRVLAAGDAHIVGLKNDGSIVATGRAEDGQLNVGNLYGNAPVVSVAAGFRHTVALRADGTVAAVGSNEHGQLNVSTWTDIVAIAAGSEHTVGLKADGTVLVAGYNNAGQRDTENWINIVDISAGDYFTIGLCADGTVIAVGKNHKGQCNTGNWRDVVEIAGGNGQAVALLKNGEMVQAGEISQAGS